MNKRIGLGLENSPCIPLLQVEILCKLDHQGIARFREVSRTVWSGVPCLAIAMEYAAGGELWRRYSLHLILIALSFFVSLVLSLATRTYSKRGWDRVLCYSIILQPHKIRLFSCLLICRATEDVITMNDAQKIFSQVWQKKQGGGRRRNPC